MAECSRSVSVTYNLTLLAFCTATIELRNFFTLGGLKTKDVYVVPFCSERILGVGNLFLCSVRVGMRRPYSAEQRLVDSYAFLYVQVVTNPNDDLSGIKARTTCQMQKKKSALSLLLLSVLLIFSCTAPVEDIPVGSISLDKPSLELQEGEVAQLKATVLPKNATDTQVTWSSSNQAVSTVNNGTATLLDFGIRFNTYDATIFYDFNLHEI